MASLGTFNPTDMVSDERIIELINDEPSTLRFYLRLGITSRAWECFTCRRLYPQDVRTCNNCFTDWLHCDRESLTDDVVSYVHSQWERCFYCGCEFRENRTIDHQDPKIQGGSNRVVNLVSACRSCNSQKGGKTVEQYRDYLGRKSGQFIVFYGERNTTQSEFVVAKSE
jgi:5-methylcytosine-specific restriction endonuclease McrA